MMMHLYPMPIRDTGIPWFKRENVKMIQKHLRLTTDQAHVLFIANSSFPTHPWP